MNTRDSHAFSWLERLLNAVESGARAPRRRGLSYGGSAVMDDGKPVSASLMALKLKCALELLESGGYESESGADGSDEHKHAFLVGLLKAEIMLTPGVSRNVPAGHAVMVSDSGVIIARPQTV